MARPIVAVVGRPNVGKSSLFNRIIGRRQAVVDPTPGVTRDRLGAEAEWSGRSFLVVDTGGLVPGSSDQMELRIADQVDAAMEEADLILFVTDVQTGVTDLDQAVARQLRKTQRPVLLLANKVDTGDWESDAHQFFALGLGDPVSASAMTGRFMGDMLDRLVELLPAAEQLEDEDRGIAVALVGRPNVGKSSLVNALVGAEKVLVDSAPGTTRDSTDTSLVFDGIPFTLIDTAGLRRHKARYRDRDSIEYFSVLRTINAIERCQVGVVLLDSLEHLVKQDIEIIEQVHSAGKALVIAANKWDLVPDKDTETAGAFVREAWRRYPFSRYLPVVLISALTNQRIHRVLTEVAKAHGEWRKRIETGVLNRWLGELNRTKPVPASKAGYPRVKYATQVTTGPPTFVFSVNDPDFISTQARRYLERSLREAFGFTGAPIRMKFNRK